MTDPARIQRIAAAVHACTATWEPGACLIGNVTAAEIRELAIAASQAVAPPEPVAVVEWSPPGEFASYSEAHAGPLVLSVWIGAARTGWGWEVLHPTARDGGGVYVARIESRHPGLTIDAAKAAAIAAARAWRDSIRL